VVDNYPNTEEGKSTRHFEGPNSFLEKLDFKTTDTKNWRVLYKVAVSEENSTKIIEEKIKIYVRCYLSGFKLFLR
jgi:hypothetical protein